MSYLIIAVLFGFLLAVLNNITDLFTITDFESIHGPIICIPHEKIQKTMDENNGLRNTILSVTYTDIDGNKKHTYLRAPINIMSMTDSSKKSLLTKALRRANERPTELVKLTAMA